MESVQTLLGSRRFTRAVTWGSALIFVAGVVAFVVVYFGDSAPSYETPLTNKPAQTVAQDKTVPVSNEVRQTARTFLTTAVARNDLATAWKVAGPGLKAGMTYKEWMSGNIPVVPYPARAVDLNAVPFKVDESYADNVLLEVALLPKAGSGEKPQVFFIELNKYGKGKNARWLVDGWVPRALPAVPDDVQ